MKIVATPWTAAAAGVFSAVAWPLLWDRFGGSGAAFDVGLVAGTLLLVALPAHAFVLGFARPAPVPGGGLDTALLRRAGAWIAAALATVGVGALVGG